MGGLFGGGKPAETNTNPWKNFEKAPEFFQDYVETNYGGLNALQKEALHEAMLLADRPRDIEGASDRERGALRDLRKATKGYGRGIDDLLGGLGGDYESEYTDDVVDTTLEGIQRQHDRDRLAREGRAASVGGTSNTRAAVGEAVAEQLTGMNMAEMEAKLRDDAFRFGTEAGFKDTELQEDLLGAGLEADKLWSGAKGSFGELQRDIRQQRNDARRGSGQEAYSWLGSILGGTQTSMPMGGQTQEQAAKPSPFSSILGAGASILGGFLSDEDAKDFSGSPGLLESPEGALDVVRNMPDMERYSYKDDLGHRRDEHAGIRAQGLEKAHPDLVRKREDGLKEVDSFLMLNTVAQAVKELDRRTS